MIAEIKLQLQARGWASKTRHFIDDLNTSMSGKPNIVITLAFAVLAVWTEILSAFHELTKAGVVFLWTCLVLLLAALVVSAPDRASLERRNNEKSSPVATATWVAVCCVIAVTLLLAVSSAPTNYDSMTYHLPRVEHWIQNRSLGFYPTIDPRQLFSAPFAEILICQLELITNGDYFCNVVQWSCFVISIFSAARIAGRLGGDRSARAFAALFASTVPMAILQSTGTQNDLVVTCFLMLLLEAYFQSADTGKDHLLAIVIGLDAGLAFYSKGYAVFFVTPILAAYGVRTLKIYGSSAISLLAETSIASLVIVAPFLFRVSPQFDRMSSGTNVPFAEFGVKQFATKIVYDALTNMSYPLSGLDDFLSRLGQMFRSRILADDGGILFSGIPFQIADLNGYDPDLIGNPIHVAIIVIFLGWLLFGTKSLDNRRVWEGLLLVGFGIVMESAGLRWQPWITRLEMTGFIMMMPLAAVVLQQGSPRLIASLAAIAFVAAIPCCLENGERPLINVPSASVFSTDRASRMFAANGIYQDAVQAIVGDIVQRKANRIGLMIEGNDWEYPYWVLLREKLKARPTIRSACASYLRYGMSEELSDEWRAEVLVVQKSDSRTGSDGKDSFNAESKVDCAGATYQIANSYRISWNGKDAILSLYALDSGEATGSVHR